MKKLIKPSIKLPVSQYSLLENLIKNNLRLKKLLQVSFFLLLYPVLVFFVGYHISSLENVLSNFLFPELVEEINSLRCEKDLLTTQNCYLKNKLETLKVVDVDLSLKDSHFRNTSFLTWTNLGYLVGGGLVVGLSFVGLSYVGLISVPSLSFLHNQNLEIQASRDNQLDGTIDDIVRLIVGLNKHLDEKLSDQNSQILGVSNTLCFILTLLNTDSDIPVNSYERDGPVDLVFEDLSIES